MGTTAEKCSTGLPVYGSDMLCTAYAVWDEGRVICSLEVGLMRPGAWAYMHRAAKKDSGNSYLGGAPDPKESVRMFCRVLAIKSHQKLEGKLPPPLVPLQWHYRLDWTFCCLSAKKYLQSTVPFSRVKDKKKKKEVEFRVERQYTDNWHNAPKEILLMWVKTTDV